MKIKIHSFTIGFWIWWALFQFTLGLDQTGHLSFLTGQDQTPKLAGQVLTDRTKSELIFSFILHNNHDILILFR